MAEQRPRLAHPQPGNSKQHTPRLARFGLGLAVAAVFTGVVVVALSAGWTWFAQGTLDHWLLSTTFTIERLLPLVGAGFLLGQLPARFRLPVLLILGFGLVSALITRDTLMLLLAPLPGAATHFFLVGPIACLIVGLLLVLPAQMRFWPAMILMPSFGSALGLAIYFSDPSLHDRFYLPLALPVALWLILIAALVTGLVTAAWTRIGVRVYGSWLVAIGMLYGGAYMASKQTQLVPPPFVEPPPASGDYPGFQPLLKSLDRHGPQRPVLGTDHSGIGDLPPGEERGT
ncbi:hypothetical protein [Allorhizobium taibaishanense]|uniref:Uncharacterized protein n=1 Tax=Allorhizobium taibaishanense TaxID=887144 RepID=A0A1Q9ABF4_9HYPH|nr:hypothetical protein [Allorhizobium taibaishanense]MBB4010160.1 hypothetical protein [Allorhizobium taibaishanense]OLP52166.1 hypothetical protein BJF91_02700 [Allorhizobium taibaishanense]